MNQFGSLDWILIALYFAAIFGVAWGVVRRKRETRESTTGYFLAGRNVGWFVVGTALFASNQWGRSVPRLELIEFLGITCIWSKNGRVLISGTVSLSVLFPVQCATKLSNSTASSW